MPEFRTTITPIHMTAPDSAAAARRAINDALDILGDRCLGVTVELMADDQDTVLETKTYTIGADTMGDVNVAIIAEPASVQAGVLVSLELAWHRAYTGPMGDKTSASDLVRIAEPIVGVQLDDDGGTAQALYDDLCNSLTIEQCVARFVARLTERGLLGLPV